MEEVIELFNRFDVHPTEDGTGVKCVNIDDLLAAKEAVARGKDADDIKFLKAKKEAQQR